MPKKSNTTTNDTISQGPITADTIPPDKGVVGKGTPALRATPAPSKSQQPEPSSESSTTATKQ